ncbi:MraY family glycosyltransferase [Magnetococcales bacterium HHB-1]
MFWIILPVAFFVTLGICHGLAYPGGRWTILDHPNHRSLHQNPTPRTGGLAILSGWLLSFAILRWQIPMPALVDTLIIALLLTALLSFLDDLWDLSQIIRLLGQFFIAALLFYEGLHLSLAPWITLSPWLSMIITLFTVVWMMNLYNFMDGMDGFAGGMALFSFTTLALLAGLQHDQTFMALALITASASAGFLWVNFPPAKIFMGDMGSVPMGLLAVFFSLWGVERGLFTLITPLILFSPFWVDATTTLIRRMIKREKFWQPHRSHYYQWLVQQGWGHRKTVLAEFLVMTVASVTALLLYFIQTSWFISLVSLVWILFYVLLLWIRHYPSALSRQEEGR